MSYEQRKALQSIILCRTPAMGGRSYRCSHCDENHFAWHSCNHRLCPRCGSSATAQWVEDKLKKRLPVAHYMVTFTLPAQLREIYRQNAREFLKRFYACSAQSVKDVLGEPRHLGGECGFIGVLQTWTQDLRLHPHIHYIVPAVGIDSNGKVCRPKRARWLARGEVFASRLRTLLVKSLEKEGLLARSLADKLWKTTWNCDVEDFGNGANAIKYLGSYLCKGPISDKRILSLKGNTIAIAVKDRKTGAVKPVEMNVLEFMDRYLQHALPSGFHAVRYYGILHPRAESKFNRVSEQLGVGLLEKPEDDSSHQPPEEMLCPRCRKPMEKTAQVSRAPPDERTIPEIWYRKDRRVA